MHGEGGTSAYGRCEKDASGGMDCDPEKRGVCAQRSEHIAAQVARIGKANSATAKAYCPQGNSRAHRRYVARIGKANSATTKAYCPQGNSRAIKRER